MPSLLLNRDTPLGDRTKEESGDRSSPIWLLVNPKYPAVIYNIWTPMVYEIQDRVYRKLHARIDTKNIFIKNAVSDIKNVSSTSNWAVAEAAKEVMKLRANVLEYQPRLLITFGSVTYEFLRRVLDIGPEKIPKYWSSPKLGDEFERSIANFDINQTNWLPLPHQVLNSGKFIDDGKYSNWENSENYFHVVGTKIADKIIENKDSLKIWIG